VADPAHGRGRSGSGPGRHDLIRDRDGEYPALLDAILADTGITVVLSGGVLREYEHAA